MSTFLEMKAPTLYIAAQPWRLESKNPRYSVYPAKISAGAAMVTAGRYSRGGLNLR
jgi:hypothetical protein